LQLVKYDAACKAIAECKMVDEVKKFVDVAEATRAYAKQAKNKQLEVDAAEIRFRAERRLGELLKLQKEKGGGLNVGRRGQLRGKDSSGGAKAEPPEDPTPTLAELGIDKKLSSRAQKIAAVKEDVFESEIAQWRERVSLETERVTTNLLREGERRRMVDKFVEQPIPRCVGAGRGLE